MKPYRLLNTATEITALTSSPGQGTRPTAADCRPRALTRRPPDTQGILSLSIVFTVANLTLACATVSAALFDSGSDGSGGDLIVEGNQTVPLPPDGVLRYGKVHIKPDAVLTF